MSEAARIDMSSYCWYVFKPLRCLVFVTSRTRPSLYVDVLQRVVAQVELSGLPITTSIMT